jgi:hypothetical protein
MLDILKLVPAKSLREHITRLGVISVSGNPVEQRAWKEERKDTASTPALKCNEAGLGKVKAAP